jgi:hypothetical protein
MTSGASGDLKFVLQLLTDLEVERWPAARRLV